MKLRQTLSLWFLVVSLFCNSMGFADEDSEGLVLPLDFQNRFSLGIDLAGFSYQEVITPPGRSTEKGFLPGGRAEIVSALGTETLFFRASADVVAAAVTYSGTDWNGDPVQTHSDDFFANGEVDAGAVLAGSLQSTRFVGYLGFGMRDWRRQLGGGDGYLENYFWCYLPVGFRWEKDLGERWSLDLDGSFRFGFAGTIAVKLSQLGTELADTSGKLGTVLGTRGEFAVNYLIAKSIGFRVGPWIEYYAIAAGPQFPVASQQGSALYDVSEPASHSLLYGGYASVAFAW